MDVNYSSDEFSSDNEVESRTKEEVTNEGDEDYYSDEPCANDKVVKDAQTAASLRVKKTKEAKNEEKPGHAMDSDEESSDDDMKKVKRGKELASKAMKRGKFPMTPLFLHVYMEFVTFLDMDVKSSLPTRATTLFPSPQSVRKAQVSMKKQESPVFLKNIF